MAVVEEIRDGEGMIGELPDVQLRPDGTLTALAHQVILNAVSALVKQTNGNVSLGNGASHHHAGNLAAEWVEHLFVTAGTTEIIPHGLKRRAIGYIPCAKDRACDIYEVNRGSWDEAHMQLRSSVSGATVLLLVF